jgi:histidinol-phosphatase (PHP family)
MTPAHPLGNFHTHTRHCDGAGEPHEFVEAALRKGMRRLGFSGHNVLPFPTTWTMPAGNLESYLREVREVKARFRDRLDIFLGIEADYLPGVTSPVHPAIQGLNLDFVVGSVHFVAPENGRAAWTVDDTVEEFETLTRESFAGDVRAVVERYYRLVAEMAESATPDIIGHFDLVKKTNRDGRWFDEDAAWYRDAVSHALDAVKRSGSIMEINTGGVVRNTSGAYYPSEWILREACRRGIAVMVNADAHKPEHIDGHFVEAARLLRGVGYTTQRQLTASGWIDEKL